MKRLSHAKRRDANEQEIVDTLKAMGASYILLDDFDILVGYHGIDFKIEVKTKVGRTTDAQDEMIKNWRGTPLHIVRTRASLIDLLNRGVKASSANV